MSDITTTNMDVDVDYSTSTPSAEAESGVSDTMDILLDANRPIRPNLASLIQPGLVAEYTTAQFSHIHDIIATGMDVDYDLPAGASGAWGALQKYDGSALEGNIVWSFDQFATALRSVSVDIVEYIVGSGIPGYVAKGDNDPGAGDTGRDKQDFKFCPVVGLEKTILNLDDLKGYGWNEINFQFGRLAVTVKDCFGDPKQGVYVLVEQTGDMFLTDITGKVNIEMDAGSYDITSLRGSLTKHADIVLLAEKTLDFSFAGFHITAIGGDNLPLIGTLALIEEVGDEETYTRYTDIDGIVKFPDLKIATKYKITVANYWREQISGGEEVPIYISFTPQLVGWNPPPGYPSQKGSIVIYVRDGDTGKPVEGLKMHVYDDTLEFFADTGIEGRTGFIIPALTDFTLEIIELVDKRYLPYKEEIHLASDELKTFIKELKRRIAIGQY